MQQLKTALTPKTLYMYILLIRNHMIFLVQFGIDKHLLIFSKTINCTRPTCSFNFVSFWKTLTRSYLFQIAREKSYDYVLITYMKTYEIGYHNYADWSKARVSSAKIIYWNRAFSLKQLRTIKTIIYNHFIFSHL